jgi:Tol biopolymer transport system component
MLTKSGAKLLDFGLAKPREQAVVTGQTETTLGDPLTGRGTILGTLQYMAPEQLEGKEADERTDIFAFGCVLYEMLTGNKLFSGTTAASVISAIMSAEPPAESAIQALSPPEVARLLTRCLAKDPEGRWQSARDVQLELSWIVAGPRGAPSLATNMATATRNRLVWALGGLLFLALIGGSAAILVNRRTPGAAVYAVRFVITPPDKATFSVDLDAQAVSPDGQYIAFVASPPDGTPRLWVRRLDSLEVRTLAGTDGAAQPFWSPDSRFVGFFAGGKLRTVHITGGPPQTLADAPFPLGGSWNREGVILFGRDLGSPLFRVSAGGGATAPMTSLGKTKDARNHGSPFFLPDGRHFFFVAGTSPTTGSVYIGSLDSNEAKLLLQSNSAAVYSPLGYMLFLRESTLMAQPFDLGDLSTRGEAVAVTEGVGRSFGIDRISVSDNGTLIYRPGVAGHRRLVWINRAGESQGIAAPAGIYQYSSLSPDEKRVAFARPGDAGLDVWLTDLERRITSRFTFRPPLNNVPIWSPDGRQIVFASARDGLLDLYTRASDASGPETLLLRLQSQPILFPSDWSSDGRLLAYYRSDPKTQLDIWTLSLDTDRRSGSTGRADSPETPKPVPFLKTEFNESQGQFSPDGRWMAYVSDESGTQQVYVQSFPRLGGQRQISTEGGNQPRWRRDGKELFYLAPDRRLMAVSVKTDVAFEADAPRALFQTELNTGELRQTYAVSADGHRFLLNTPLEEEEPPIAVVLNWPALLKN